MLFAGTLVAGSSLTYFIGFSASISDCFLVPATSFDVRITENFFQKTLDFICFLQHPTGILRTYVLT